MINFGSALKSQTTIGRRYNRFYFLILLINNLKGCDYLKKFRFFYCFCLVFIVIFATLPCAFASSYPKLITTLTSAFEKIESWILRISTPAAAISAGSGVLMKKFSFGDEERIRTGKRLIRGSLFSYAFILCIDLILSTINTLLA